MTNLLPTSTLFQCSGAPTKALNEKTQLKLSSNGDADDTAVAATLFVGASATTAAAALFMFVPW